MKTRSAILLKLAECYDASSAGRHGEGKIDFQREAEALLAESGCSEGEKRELAERDLRAAAAAGVIKLTPVHRLEPGTIGKIRLSPANEQAFFDLIGSPSPTQRRMEWATLFVEASSWDVPDRFRTAWQAFCDRRAAAARNWRGMHPFDRDDLATGRELLALLPPLLHWEGKHLVRWASSILCGHSKTLERRQARLESLLADATNGAMPTLESLGILPVPAGVTFHGPIRLRIGDDWRDFRNLHGPTTLAETDVNRITACECEAHHCLTIENKHPFLSLIGLQSGELLIHTSYPSHATLELLSHVAASASPPDFWHFGDTDPSGFHILADLRRRSGIAFRIFQMQFRPDPSAPALSTREKALLEELIPQMPAEADTLRAIALAGNKGDFEQESLRPPTLQVWPFY